MTGQRYPYEISYIVEEDGNMEWINDINQSLHFMERNLTNQIGVEDVTNQIYTSSSHFQRIFNMVTGFTIGEYIRNRRLSLAGQDLLKTNSKVIDIALKYQYDTPESFSKAFYRFHGINPSEVKNHPNLLKYFHPLTLHISMQGGFHMVQGKMNEFYWSNVNELNRENLSDNEKYQLIVNWAGKARCQNPMVFDTLTEWLLDDTEWSSNKLAQNKQILMGGVLGRFKEQNAQLRAYLKQLEPSGIVNQAVFKMLDRFDRELSGIIDDEYLQDAVTKVFADFSAIKDRHIRELFAGNKTGPTGTDSVELFGYINRLKESDASVQWTLFMPDEVERKQVGFRVKSFEYLNLPALRFIGFEGEEYVDVEKRMDKMKILDSLTEYVSGFDYDLFLMHFYGLGVDVGQWHGIFGRFMKADTPVPEGFLYFDFETKDNGIAGPPYLSQFAFATFTGDANALHQEEGFDGDAMYDTTRNIILGQGGEIPYPNKDWTAEVFMDGCDKISTGYLFSAKP